MLNKTHTRNRGIHEIQYNFVGFFALFLNSFSFFFLIFFFFERFSFKVKDKMISDMVK